MPKTLKQTPAELGYSYPPDWAPHAATWLSWPRPEGESFPGKYEPVPANMAAIIRQIALRERVEIAVQNENYEIIVRRELAANQCPLDNVRLHQIPTNECWCRDHGPAFVVREKSGGGRDLAIVNWRFNAWGGKYPRYEDDDAVPLKIAEILDLPVFQPGIIMEGGAVDFNGRGTVLTTESSLLNPNRNPDLSKEQTERYLRDYYGQKHVLWLKGDDLAGDDTDGHIDNIARFIDPGTLVVGVEEDNRDENHGVLQDYLKQVRAILDQDGQPFRIVEIPMPGVVEHAGQRLPATYINFHFVNGALLVPTYRHENDQRALTILQEHLPDHQVIGIDCVDLIWGLGALHCLTQQQPV